MRTTISNTYEFIAGHYLPKVPAGHKCARQHGHNYLLQVLLTGEPRSDGMLIDFFEVDAVVKPLLARIDHRNLNDIKGLENPTAELIAAWFADELSGAMARAVTVRIYETPTCYAEVSADAGA